MRHVSDGTTREKDIMIFSCVRAPEQSWSADSASSSGAGVGFLDDWRRLNVAITRAKFAMWIVGHAGVLKQSSEWRELINDSKKRGAFIDASPDPSPDPSSDRTSESNTRKLDNGSVSRTAGTRACVSQRVAPCIGSSNLSGSVAERETGQRSGLRMNGHGGGAKHHFGPSSADDGAVGMGAPAPPAKTAATIFPTPPAPHPSESAPLRAPPVLPPQAPFSSQLAPLGAPPVLPPQAPFSSQLAPLGAPPALPPHAPFSAEPAPLGAPPPLPSHVWASGNYYTGPP